MPVSPYGIDRLVDRAPSLAPLLERLDGITGFVSVLGEDPRIDVFRRSRHVRRVVRIAASLCDAIPSARRDDVLIAALCHDLNRLPFAHNLEKRIGFDQSASFPGYLAAHGVEFPRELVDDIVGVINKNVRGSETTRLAFAADATAGFVEDPLFAVTTLGVSPSFLPPMVVEHLGLDFSRSPLRERAAELSRRFQEVPAQFTELFDDTVFALAQAFLASHNRDGKLFVDLPDFESLRQALKEGFLRAHLFPLNNERVSQGSRLATEIGLPVIERLREEGRDPITALLEMTDQQLVAEARRRELIRDVRSFDPRLDACRSASS
jgi:hypothetical protein